MIAYRLRGLVFLYLPELFQYARRLRPLTPQIAQVLLTVAELLAEGRVRLADGYR